MKKTSYHLEHFNTIPKEYEEILYHEISDNAFQKKGLSPIRSFSIFIKTLKENVLGGISGTIFYGSLYIDSLWVDTTIRQQGWGTKLMDEAEKIGKQHGTLFATLNRLLA